MRKWACLLAWGALASAGSAQSGLFVEIGDGRSTDRIEARTVEAMRLVGTRTARLSAAQRAWTARRTGETVPFALPQRLTLTQNGVPLPFQPGGRSTELTLQFETTGPRAFPTEYRTLLTNTFNQAFSAMVAVAGQPARAQTIRVLNFDADIADRTAVAGGAYVPNAPGGPEIRFPVFNNPTAAAIHFVHCVLLAFQADQPYPNDAFSEGLVRAATMRVARTPNTLGGAPARDQIESVLESAYDVGTYYDWFNQPGLGGPRFIAPNLLDTPLPAGGNTGGVFLLRYQMAGTAWAKLAAEHPAFIAEFNRQYNQSPAAYQTVESLVTLGQSALDVVAGVPNATVEGRPFADWFARQSVFETRVLPGVRMNLQAFPIPATPGSSDFGPFGLVLNAWSVAPNGNETLLAGRAFPIYWTPDWGRFFLTAQDDLMNISGAYGSVAPNFPAIAAPSPHRVTVDVPFSGRVARLTLPAGAISTGVAPVANTVFGTLRGVPEDGATYSVRLTYPLSPTAVTINATRFAFGATIPDENFLQPQSVRVEVLRRVGGNAPTVLFERRVNKTFGPLALELRPPASETTLSGTVPSGLSLFGLSAQPWQSEALRVLGSAPADTLIARWSPTAARYSLFPEEGTLDSGLGYYVNLPTARTVSGPAVRDVNVPVTVALQPGWNMVSNPTSQSVSLSQVRVTTGTDAVFSYNEARGSVLGSTTFGFTQDPVNRNLGTLAERTTLSAGQAFWVRCDRAEGATLIFPAEGAVMMNSISGPSTAWEMRFRVSNRQRQVAEALFGTAVGATDTWDARFDSGLPPSAGGLQVLFAGDLYRDIRAYGRAATWTLSVGPLVPGQTYTVSLGRKTAFRPVSVLDVAGRRTFNFRAGGQFTFTARTVRHAFEIRAGAVR